MNKAISKDSSKAKRTEEEKRSQERDVASLPSGPAGDILTLQRSAGNRAVNELLQSGTNAERPAHDLRGKAQPSTEGELKPLPSANASLADAKGLPDSVRSFLSGSSGGPLEPSTRAFMEGRFGYDFRAVRVHTGKQAADSARAVNAAAYTVGRDIVLGDRRNLAGTGAGKELFAHELAHTIQQGSTGASAPSLSPRSSSEHAADTAAQQVTQGGPVGQLGSTAVGMARKVLEPIGVIERLDDESLLSKIESLTDTLNTRGVLTEESRDEAAGKLRELLTQYYERLSSSHSLDQNVHIGVEAKLALKSGGETEGLKGVQAAKAPLPSHSPEVDLRIPTVRERLSQIVRSQPRVDPLKEAFRERETFRTPTFLPSPHPSWKSESKLMFGDSAGFQQAGQIVTKTNLLEWAARELPVDGDIRLLTRRMESYEFVGSGKERQRWATFLVASEDMIRAVIQEETTKRVEEEQLRQEEDRIRKLEEKKRIKREYHRFNNDPRWFIKGGSWNHYDYRLFLDMKEREFESFDAVDPSFVNWRNKLSRYQLPFFRAWVFEGYEGVMKWVMEYPEDKRQEQWDGAWKVLWWLCTKEGQEDHEMWVQAATAQGLARLLQGGQRSGRGPRLRVNRGQRPRANVKSEAKKESDPSLSTPKEPSTAVPKETTPQPLKTVPKKPAPRPKKAVPNEVKRAGAKLAPTRRTDFMVQRSGLGRRLAREIMKGVAKVYEDFPNSAGGPPVNRSPPAKTQPAGGKSEPLPRPSAPRASSTPAPKKPTTDAPQPQEPAPNKVKPLETRSVPSSSKPKGSGTAKKGASAGRKTNKPEAAENRKGPAAPVKSSGTSPVTGKGDTKKGRRRIVTVPPTHTKTPSASKTEKTRAETVPKKDEGSRKKEGKKPRVPRPGAVRPWRVKSGAIANPELAKRAREEREVSVGYTLSDLSNRNVAVMKIKITYPDGTFETDYITAVNSVKDQHAEFELVLARAEKARELGVEEDAIEVKQVFTERSPCGPKSAGCGELLKSFPDANVYRATTKRGKEAGKDLEIFYGIKP